MAARGYLPAPDGQAVRSRWLFALGHAHADEAGDDRGGGRSAQEHGARRLLLRGVELQALPG